MLNSLMVKMIFLAMFLLCSVNVTAAEKEMNKGGKTSTKLINKNIQISDKIDSMAKGLDVALAGKSSDETPNLTRIIIRNQLNWGEGGLFTYTPNLNLNLHLPNLEKKWRLHFSTTDEDQESRGVNKNRLKTTPSRRSYGGGVGLVQQLGQINTEFEPRFEYRDQVVVSYILKFKSANSSPRDEISFRPELHLFGRSDNGVGEFIPANIDFPITKSLLFTIINEEEYVDRDNVFSTNSGIKLSYEHNEKVSQDLSLVYESSSRPNFHLDRYTVASGVYYKMYKNILHMAFIPYLLFPRNLDYRISPGVIFEFNLIF